MKKKIVGILICMLFVASALSSSANTSMFPVNEKQMDLASFSINEEELNSDLQDFSFVPETKIERVTLKFFNYSGFSKNLTRIVKNINKIFAITEGKDNVQFDWNKTSITLPNSDFSDKTSAGRRNLLSNLKKRKNCSKGINIVFAPNNYLPEGTNGVTRKITCQGVRDTTSGGIIINDTCNETQMTKTLAHELMHALGLSHDQIKIWNASSNKFESKNKTTSVKNSKGEISQLWKSWLGFSCPPHGYGYWDRDGDCWCNYSSDPTKNEVRPGGGFDINGNCTFGDAEDRANLLWGYANTRTAEGISDAQRDYMYNNAKKTPNPKPETIGESSEEQAVTPSYAFPDDVIDLPAEFGYVNIVGSIGILYWDDYLISLSLGVMDKMPDDLFLYYDFYIDEDNDLDTGSSCGSEYIVAFTKSPEYTGAQLWAYIGGEMEWLYLGDLSWSTSSTVSVWHSDDDCGITDANDNRVNVIVPIGILNLRFKGDMKITAKTTDYINNVADECPPIFLSKEIEFLPMLDLITYTGSPGDTIFLSGMLFTPNADVSLDFNWVEVSTAATNSEGGFTGYFTVPSVPGGYYPVKATDEHGKDSTRTFYVEALENQPPSVPTITGNTNGKAREEYTYMLMSTDPEGDDITYFVDWDDGDTDIVGPSQSGEQVSSKHKWDTQGTYNVKAQARDANGAESEWATLEVSMPRNKAMNTPFLDFLENHPLLYQLLQRFFNR